MTPGKIFTIKSVVDRFRLDGEREFERDRRRWWCRCWWRERSSASPSPEWFRCPDPLLPWLKYHTKNHYFIIIIFFFNDKKTSIPIVTSMSGCSIRMWSIHGYRFSFQWFHLFICIIYVLHINGYLIGRRCCWRHDTFLYQLLDIILKTNHKETVNMCQATFHIEIIMRI